MTVRTRSLVTWMVGFVAVGLVFGGLSVEVITGSQVSRAQRALPGALARAVATNAFFEEGQSEDAGAAAVRQLAAARRHLGTRSFEESAKDLESLAAEHPSATAHRLAAQARLAAGDGKAAGRHAHLAMRLAPDDAQLAAQAEQALDHAVAWHVRPATRPLTAVGGVLLALLLAAGWHHRRDRRRRAEFLDNVTARLRLWADGEPLAHGAALKADTESLIIDVFLSGRYGMACPRRPKDAPTLHLVWSNAQSSQTIRQRAIKHVSDSAVRVPVQPETLKRVLSQPGAWRLHARLGDRPLVSRPVSVAPPRPEPAGKKHGFRLLRA